MPITSRINPFGRQTVASSGIKGAVQTVANIFNNVISDYDSLDVVVIGDSNSGNNGGYTVGMREAIQNYGAFNYATPLLATAYIESNSANNRAAGLYGNYTKSSWSGNTTVSNGTIYTLEYQASISNSPAIALISAINYGLPPVIPSTGSGSVSGNGELRPNGWAYGAAYVLAGSTYTTYANNNFLKLGSRSPILMSNGEAGQSCQYRVVYGTFPTGTGSINLRAMKSVNTTLASGSSVVPSLDAVNGYGYNTATLNFTSLLSTTANYEPEPITCSFDGFNNSTMVGPAAVFWHSIIRKVKKGFSVSNLTYNGGHSTGDINTVLSVRPGLLKMFLKELYERQVAAGGSGNVCVFCNSGINGHENGTTYTTNINSIKETFKTAWNSLGYSSGKLSFIFSVTHPAPASGVGTANWDTERPETISTALAWATTNQSTVFPTVVFDIGTWFSAARLTAHGLYDPYQATTTTNPSAYHAHLKGLVTIPVTTDVTTNGYNGAAAGNYIANGDTHDLSTGDNAYTKICVKMIQQLLLNIGSSEIDTTAEIAY